MMKVRTDLRAGQAVGLDPGQLAQWAQSQMQAPASNSTLTPAAVQLAQLAQKPLDARTLPAALQSAAGPLNPQQFLSLVGTMQGYVGSPG
jgi:hypothetical protein